MTGSLKYHSDIQIFISLLKSHERNDLQAPGLLDIIFEMTGSLKYKLGILNFIFQLDFPEEDVF